MGQSTPYAWKIVSVTVAVACLGGCGSARSGSSSQLDTELRFAAIDSVHEAGRTAESAQSYAAAWGIALEAARQSRFIIGGDCAQAGFESVMVARAFAAAASLAGSEVDAARAAARAETAAECIAVAASAAFGSEDYSAKVIRGAEIDAHAFAARAFAAAQSLTTRCDGGYISQVEKHADEYLALRGRNAAAGSDGEFSAYPDVVRGAVYAAVARAHAAKAYACAHDGTSNVEVVGRHSLASQSASDNAVRYAFNASSDDSYGIIIDFDRSRAHASEARAAEVHASAADAHLASASATSAAIANDVTLSAARMASAWRSVADAEEAMAYVSSVTEDIQAAYRDRIALVSDRVASTERENFRRSAARFPEYATPADVRDGAIRAEVSVQVFEVARTVAIAAEANADASTFGRQARASASAAASDVTEVASALVAALLIATGHSDPAGYLDNLRNNPGAFGSVRGDAVAQDLVRALADIYATLGGQPSEKAEAFDAFAAAARVALAA